MNAVAVLCSRKESSRLPGKALLDLAGRSVVDHCLNRLKQIGIPVILAVPPDEYGFYQKFVKTPGIYIYAGKPESPLHRTLDAVRVYAPEATHIIRATHDDPLIDPELAKDLLIQCSNGDYGYGIVSGLIDGGGIEVIRRENLEYACETFKDNGEYIGYYAKGAGTPFPEILKVEAPDWGKLDYRITIDYLEDFLVVHAALNSLGKDATLQEVCAWLGKNSEIAHSNLLPEISYYTCVKDGDRFLGEAIRSVGLAMAGTRSEYIIVDDCSTDDSLAEALRWKGAGMKIKVLRNPYNAGLAASSNLAISNARGKWVMRIDADDLLAATKIPSMLEEANRTWVDVLYSDYCGINENGDQIFPRRENTGKHAGCALMRRAFLYEAKFRDGVRIGDWKEMRERTKGRIVEGRFSGGAAWYYRRHKDSITAQAGTGEI